MPLVQAWPVDAFTVDPGDPLVVVQIDIVDVDGDGQIGPGDTVNGNTIDNNYIGDTITVDDGTSTTLIAGTTLYVGTERFFIDLAPGGAPPLPSGTTVTSTFVNNGNQTFPLTSLGPPCFVAGTLIRTPDGDFPVETLQKGDLVETLDHGPQPIRWIGITTTHGKDNYAPVHFDKGAYGADRPFRLSPQHRVMLSGPDAELLFGEAEILVPAKHLVDNKSVSFQPCDTVDYVHILFDRHEVVFAEGVPCESFHPGDIGVTALAPEARAELLTLFPQLKEGWDTYGAAARKSLRAFEAGVMDQASS